MKPVPFDISQFDDVRLIQTDKELDHLKSIEGYVLPDDPHSEDIYWFLECTHSIELVWKTRDEIEKYLDGTLFCGYSGGGRVQYYYRKTQNRTD